MKLPKILADLLTLPTASFVEQAVLDHVETFCKNLRHVTLRKDRCGNLLARYRHHPPKAVPLVFSAHTDHPGFVALEMLDSRTLRAAFRGWVEPEYFPGARVRFWRQGRWVKGRVLEILRSQKLQRVPGRSARPEEVLLRVAEEIAPNSPGMWDLPDPRLKGDLVLARGCDDIAGVAAMLALLQALSRKQARTDVYCLFTRAEEVGFVGAIGAAKAGTIPRRCPIIAIETSKALPNAPIGDGPILRVGDKTSVFTPSVTQFCQRVASDLARRKKSFRYQRKLMDGGTCESTAFVAYGYAATGVCLALGTYHNMDVQRRKIDSEYVSLSDWQAMVDWFVALATDRQGYGAETAELRRSLDARYAEWERLLQPRATRGARKA